MLKQVILIITLTFSSTCIADTVVFNNFTHTFGYDPSGVIIGGPSGGSYFDEFAMSFTPSTTGYLSEVYFAFSSLAGHSGANYTLWLSSDDGGLPGNQETSIDFNVSDSTVTLFGNDLIHLTSSESYLLDKDTTYWLGLSSPSPGVIGAWHFSSLGNTTGIAERNLVESDQWALEQVYPSAAFSVSIAPVPVPAALWLFVSGLLALVFKSRKA